MKNKILIEIDEDEVKIALIEQGRLCELWIEREEQRSLTGNIYLGKVINVLPGIQSAFIDIGEKKNGFLSLDEEREFDKLQLGKNVLVQVSKEFSKEKGPKLTLNLSIAGHYLVFLPFGKRFGISQKINDITTRQRLKGIYEILKRRLTPNYNNGTFIFRTEAAFAREKDLLREAKSLLHIFLEIRKKEKRYNKPVLLFENLDLIFYVLREYLSNDTDSVIINSISAYREVLKYVRGFSPHLKRKLRFYKGKDSLFKKFNIEEELEKIKRKKIGLPSGGYIIIESTEALTAIDVNTGRFTKGKDKEIVSFKTNLEAAFEIMHQIRLRNIAGNIIIDFIQMENEKHKKRVLQVLLEEKKKDKAQIDILPITKMAMLEMTRQKRRGDILSSLIENCPCCGGDGKVISKRTMFIKIKKAIMEKVGYISSITVNVFVNPKVSNLFSDEVIKRIETKVKKKIRIRPDYKLKQEEFKIE